MTPVVVGHFCFHEGIAPQGRVQELFSQWSKNLRRTERRGGCKVVRKVSLPTANVHDALRKVAIFHLEGW